MTPEHFLSHSLRHHPAGEPISQMLAAAVAAVDPYAATLQHMQRVGNFLIVGAHKYDLRKFERIYLIGAGKAGTPMARAVSEILGVQLTGGTVIVKEGYATQSPPTVNIIEAGHPLPDARGVAGTEAILKCLQSAGGRDLVICVLSGGGSALLTAPVDGVGLNEQRALTSQLLASGADIHEINTVRKHLSQVKGGQLAKLAAPTTLLTLILSDVVGDNLEIIASGPTVPDPSTISEARQVLLKYGLAATLPFVETPKLGAPFFRRTQNLLVGTNRLAADAAAAAWGPDSKVLRTDLTGEAQLASEWLMGQWQQMPRGACWIAGGETTVTLPPNTNGKGGRNQEVALAAVRTLATLEDCILITLATDGGDGPTDAAGAVVTPQSLARATQLGLNPDDFLARHDAYAFFASLGDLLKPGPTQTNVNDLNFLIRT